MDKASAKKLSQEADVLCLELERESQSGTDAADVLDWVGDLLGFLGSAEPGWWAPGAPPESSAPPELIASQRESFMALQRRLVALRSTARAASQEVLEREGWGNSEWALDRLSRITNEAWRDEADDPGQIVRSAIEALSRPDLSEEALNRLFNDADAPCGYLVLFDAVQTIRGDGSDALVQLESLLEAVRLHGKLVQSGDRPATWIEQDLFENLKDYVKELGGSHG